MPPSQTVYNGSRIYRPFSSTVRDRDVVCVLLGGDVPFIIKLSKSNYSLVGESYGKFSGQLKSHLC